MISLGIIVVYVVPTAYERMLELHLRQIAKHTRVAYSVFGCAERSSPRAIDLLRSNPRVRLLPCSPTTDRGTAEHAHYLDQLARLAIEAGSTHVATLHVDSFPIRDDWVETMHARLSDGCVLVTARRGYSSCMMFTRQFYLRCRPTFLASAGDKDRAEFAQCMKEWGLKHYSSGVGYVFQAYLAKRRVHFLPRATRPDSRAAVYDQRVFHFGGGCALLLAGASQIYRSVRAALFVAAGRLARAIVPLKARQALRRRFGRTMRRSKAERREAEKLHIRAEMQRLLADLDTYLAELTYPRR